MDAIKNSPDETPQPAWWPIACGILIGIAAVIVMAILNNWPQSVLRQLAVVFVVATLFGLVKGVLHIMAYERQAAAQASAPVTPTGPLPDARERIRDLVTIEDRLVKWDDAHCQACCTAAVIATQRAKTHVQHAVRAMQDCTVLLEQDTTVNGGQS